MKPARALFLLLALLCASLTLADTLSVGQRIEIRSTNPQGVPLHHGPHPSMFGRAANGSIVTVVELAANGHWIRVRLADDRLGWMVDRYVVRVVPGPADSSAPLPDDEWHVWTSAAECGAVVSAGRRMEAVNPAMIRVAAWNIRWFPNGEMTASPGSSETDLPWLACAIAWMNLDVLAVEESRTTPEALDAWESVRDGLQALTSAEWRVDLQSCGSGQNQHVGFLWNASRVELTNPQDVWQFNGAANNASEPCAGNLRPGRYAYARALNGGADFHLFVVHLDSGTGNRDFDNRQTAYKRIPAVVQPLLAQDRDVVILGDFNTMGKAPNITGEQETQSLSTLAASLAPPFERVQVEPPCSEYFNGEGGLLDQFLITRDMAEVETRRIRVSGYCALASCAHISGEMPPAYKRLSDHCPLVIQIRNQDMD